MHPSFISKKMLGDSAFMTDASKRWNMLPSDARNETHFKTFLLKEAF